MIYVSEKMAYLIVIFLILIALAITDAIKESKKTSKDKRQEEIRSNWNNFYEQQEQIRLEEIKNDPYYNLDADDKYLARQIKVDRSEPTFEEWKAVREAERQSDTESSQ